MRLSRFFLSSLLIATTGVPVIAGGLFGSLVSADFARAETPEMPAPKTVDPVVQQLMGRWQTKEPLDGDTVVFVFAPEGQVFLMVNPVPEGGRARELRYRVNAQVSPMQLDIILSDSETVLTVFEFTPAGDLRLQMLGTQPGKPRPTALKSNATLFGKISDATTLPDKVERAVPQP